MINRTIAFPTAGLVITGEDSDAFKQGRFADAVLADDDSDGAIETELEIVVQQRQAEQIGLAVSDPRRIEPSSPRRTPPDRRRTPASPDNGPSPARSPAPARILRGATAPRRDRPSGSANAWP